MRTGRIFLMLLMVLVVSDGLQAQWLWDADKMKKIKGQLALPAYKAAYQRLIRHADHELSQDIYSVTQKEGVAPSGDKHDYVSLSRYWWPNPDTPSGLPYVYK